MEITRLENDITVYEVKASSFPDGVMQAHQSLHALVPFEQSRNYFGISYLQDGKIVYWAAATEVNEGELRKHGLESFVIRKGNYIYIDVKDYMQNTEKIGNAFQQLIADRRIDPMGACVEWYLDRSSCRCMVRLAD